MLAPIKIVIGCYKLKKTVIVIPSYWSRGPITENDVIYDHPTDLLNPSETISKTLKSFEKITGKFDVLVVGCPSRVSIGKDMDRTLLEIIKNSNLSYRISYFGSKEFKVLKTFIEEKTSNKFSDLISNLSYGNVRNLCLLIPHLLDYNTVILIDDDEIVKDQSFVQTATEFIGSQVEDKILGLIVGYYENADGTIFRDESEVPWWNLVWEKEKLMNEAFRIITDSKSERLVDTPFAFGGNMVIDKSCWEQVPFDPLIARGEDMDYLRNVKYFGFNVKLDRNLSIRHEPPNASTSYEIKFQQDIRRFLYSKYKLEHMKFETSEFDPYPGYFLRQTEGKIILTELLYSIFRNKDKFVELKDVNQLLEKIQNSDFYFNKVQEKCRNLSGTYFEFQKKWVELLIKSISLEIPADIISEI